MDDAALVSVLQAAGRLQDAVQRQLQRQRALFLHKRRQIAAVHVLHHKEMRARRFVGIVSDHDVGVRQPGRRLHLPLEPPHRFGRLRDFR